MSAGKLQTRMARDTISITNQGLRGSIYFITQCDYHVVACVSEATLRNRTLCSFSKTRNDIGVKLLPLFIGYMGSALVP